MKFSEMKLKRTVIEGLEEAGFEETFAIQEKATPVALKGKDVIGKAQSGSGKTLAFLIPIIERIEKGKGVQALIISPTRELALQTEDVFKKIAGPSGLRSVTVYGGRSINVQASALRSGVEVVMATPGRLMDHMKRRNVDLRGIKIVVLDEADRMLDMGFIDDIDYILKHTPRNRQTLLFSATLPNEIRKIVHRYMRYPTIIDLHKETPTVLTVDHLAWIALDGDKVSCLRHAIKTEKPKSCIIFVERKRDADRLQRTLSRYYNILALHGDFSQAQRERVLRMFRNKEITYLIATDVAARGLDIPEVSHVFNFDLPKDTETFIHRVGRTGRAGKHGRAIHIARPNELNDLAVIEHYAKVRIPKKNYRGSLSEERAMEMAEKMKVRRAIIPKWTKRTGMPGRGMRGPSRGRRGPPRRGPRRGPPRRGPPRGRGPPRHGPRKGKRRPRRRR